jgi:hypothetical protein
MPTIRNHVVMNKSKLSVWLGAFILLILLVSVISIPAIIKSHLYSNLYFYLIYILFWTWWGIIGISSRLLGKRLLKNKNDILAAVIFSSEIIIGIAGSFSIGLIVFKQGGLFAWLFFSIPAIFLTLYLLIKSRNSVHY